MILLWNLFLSVFVAGALAAVPHPLRHVVESDPVIVPFAPRTLLSRTSPRFTTSQYIGEHVLWGSYAIAFWKTAATIPVAAAAHSMAEFYQELALAAIRAFSANRVVSSCTFSFGALNLYVDTLDGSPVNWDMVVRFAGNMLLATNRGWTGHYGALVKDTLTGVLTVVSLEAAGGVADLWLNGGVDMGESADGPLGG